ncbi:MAG: hypothetical protein Q9184_005654, partial [Pyrenodesmia sp. 2 TL-2023]
QDDADIYHHVDSTGSNDRSDQRTAASGQCWIPCLGQRTAQEESLHDHTDTKGKDDTDPDISDQPESSVHGEQCQIEIDNGGLDGSVGNDPGHLRCQEPLSYDLDVEENCECYERTHL